MCKEKKHKLDVSDRELFNAIYDGMAAYKYMINNGNSIGDYILTSVADIKTRLLKFSDDDTT